MQQEPLRILEENRVVEDFVAIIANSAHNIVAERGFGAEADRNIGKFFGISGDAIHDAEMAVYGKTEPAAQVIAGQSHDRRAHRKCLVGRIATTEWETVEADVGECEELHVAIVCLAWQETNACGVRPDGLLEALPQLCPPISVLAFEQKNDAGRVAFKDRCQGRIHIGMDFEEILRQKIDRRLFRQTE